MYMMCSIITYVVDLKYHFMDQISIFKFLFYVQELESKECSPVDWDDEVHVNLNQKNLSTQVQQGVLSKLQTFGAWNALGENFAIAKL